MSTAIQFPWSGLHGDYVLLLCPMCGFNATHIHGVVFGDGDVTLFGIGECGHRFKINFIQHKGDTQVSAASWGDPL